VNREVTELWSDAIGAPGTVIKYGHWGRAVLVFPAEQGRAWDFENNGMLAAVARLLDERRLKLYCVDSYDAQSWSNTAVPLEERAQHHDLYESWIIDKVVPRIRADCGGPVEVTTLGCSLGAFHAANFALKRADLFPFAMCLSGNLIGCAAGSACYSSAVRANGRTRPARCRARSSSPRCSPTRASGTSLTSGVMTCRTTGRPGAPSSLITCRGSADHREGPP
jgi:hypothetical protein